MLRKSAMRTLRTSDGLTLVELLFAVSLCAVLAGVALPVSSEAIDRLRTAGAARYLASQIASLRMDAIHRSRAVALRFESAIPDYQFGPCVDGDGNGVRTADLRRGTDKPLAPPRQLGDNFRGVSFALASGLPDVDGARSASTDGVRIGSARILTLSPDGTATSGTLYVRGRHAQYAVRVLGATGRTRVLEYDAATRTWLNR